MPFFLGFYWKTPHIYKVKGKEMKKVIALVVGLAISGFVFGQDTLYYDNQSYDRYQRVERPRNQVFVSGGVNVGFGGRGGYGNVGIGFSSGPAYYGGGYYGGYARPVYPVTGPNHDAASYARYFSTHRGTQSGNPYAVPGCATCPR